MILVFNAAQHNSVIFSFFHGYTPKHYVYIYSLFPELVPQLPQVHITFISIQIDKKIQIIGQVYLNYDFWYFFLDNIVPIEPILLEEQLQ